MTARKIEKVLITGGTGILGRAIVSHLLSAGMDVSVAANPKSQRLAGLPLEHPNFHLYRKDGLELSALETSSDFDAIFHLAWLGTVGEERNDEILQRKNLRMLEEVFSLAEKTKTKVIVFSGSQAEYGITDEEIFEDTPMQPLTFYGKVKKEAEEKGRELSAKLKIDFVTGRVFSIYGPHDRSGALIPALVRNLLENRETDLSAGTQNWDYLYESDAAKAFELLAKFGESNEAYNVASSDVRPLKDYAESVREIVNQKGVLNFGKVNAEGPLVSLRPNISKLKKDTGFAPSVTFEEGIRNIVKNVSMI